MIEAQMIIQYWLKKRYISPKGVNNRKHLLVIMCNNAGVDAQYIAKALNMSVKTIYWILNKYKK